MAQRATKTERLEVRLTVEQKELIRHACALSGRSVSDFAAASLVDAAATTVRELQVLRLSAEASRQLADALDHPPEPTQALREAWRRRFGEA